MALLPYGSAPGLTIEDADARYLIKSGDKMLGDLRMGTFGIIFTDPNGKKWKLTVDTTGALVTNDLGMISGTPIGLLLALTYD